MPVNRAQTLIDKVFCEIIHTRNLLYEPTALRVARSSWSSSASSHKRPTEPLITVYVPTYNRGELLVERPIPSVLNQTYKNFEFLIIGDCCNDTTEELVSTIDDSRIHFHNLPSREKRYPVEGENALNHWLAGPVVAANYALSIAKGDWIARLDDSVEWTPDHLEALLNEALAGNFEFVTGDVLELRNGVRTRNKGHYAHSDYFFSKKKPLLSVGNPRLGSTSTLLYRSYLRLFKYNINCWRKRVNRVNDIDLFLRMYHAGVKMGHLDKVVCELLPRPGESDLAYQAFIDDFEGKKRHFSFNS